jgi:hypothetical protein
MKKKSLVLAILAGIFLIAVAGILFLPAILSSDFARERILLEANKRLPGKLLVDTWSLHWLSGIEVKGLIYDNREDGLLVEVPEVKNNQGLVHFIATLNSVGSVEVRDPVVYVYPVTKPAAPAPQQTPPPAAAEPAPKIPAFLGQYKITNGSVHTVNTDNSKTVVVKDIDLFVDALSLEKPLNYRLFLKSGDGSGNLSGEGTLAVSPEDPFNPGAIESDANVQINNWELQDVLTILAYRGNFPSGSGRLNANLTLIGRAAENIHMQGRLSIDKLKMWGGPLGSDRPAVNGISMELDATGNPHTLALNKLTFQSSLANGSVNAELTDQGKHRFTGKADINLAAVFTQLPNTLYIRGDTRLSKGRMALTASAETADTVTSFDASARIDQLKGISNGKKISWDKPVSVHARGEKRAKGFWLETLSLRSSFLNGDGQGDLSNMRVNLSADLQTALKEFKKFIDIRGWNGSGKLQANLQITEQSEQVNKALLNLNIDNFVLRQNRSVILPRQNLRADLLTQFVVGASPIQSEFKKTSLDIQSLLTDGKLSATQLKWNPNDPLPNVKGFTYNGHVNLQQLTSLLTNLGALPPNIQLAGSSRVQTNGSINGNQITLADARVDTQKFVYRQDNKRIRDDHIIIKTKGSIDPNTKSLYLSPLEITASPGKVRIPELAVANWSDIQKEIKTHATADLDLGKLQKGYGDLIQLPEKTMVAGRGRFDLDIDFSDPKAQGLKLKGDLSAFQLSSAALPTISEKNVKLNVDVKKAPNSKDLSIKSLQFNSRPLFIDAGGSLGRRGTQTILDTNGTFALDLNLISNYLKQILGHNIEISGKAQKPFKLKMISDENRRTDPLQNMDFAGEFHVNSIKVYGLEIAPLDIPLRIVNASADASLHGTANGGSLSLQPSIDLRKAPYMFTIPNNTDILKDAQITEALADQLMGKIHPMFKGALVGEGTIGLFMEHFKWPLASEAVNEAAFAGTLRLKGVKLRASPMLAALLAIGGAREREVTIDDLDIDFVARDGRIKTSPIQLNIGGHPLTISGSMGFDKSVDYRAQIPVGSFLFGKDSSSPLKGLSITVPIGGTASNPKIDQKAAQKKLKTSEKKKAQKAIEQDVKNLMENIFKKKKK